MAMITALDHPALAAFLKRRQVAPLQARHDGAAMLVFRDGYRVGFHPVGRGDLVMEGRIVELSGTGMAAVEALCKTALEIAGQRPWNDLDALALSADGTALLLQQWVPANCSSAALERQIDAYLDALSGWRQVLQREIA